MNFYFHGGDASLCSHDKCPRPAQSWYYSESKRLQMIFVFGRCDLHNEREYAGDNHDIAGWFVPNNAISISKETVTVAIVMKS